MTTYNIIKFNNFPSIIGQPIIINENTILFKSYCIDYGNPISNIPSFFGEIDNASKYFESKKRKLGIFTTIKKLRLLDIRYASQIINDLILLRKNNDFDTIIKGYMTISLSYGLVSLYKQIQLYQMRYRKTLSTDIRYKKIIEYYHEYEKNILNNKELFQNPLELQGIRIGETHNDIDSTIILKEIFENYIDGIISPSIFSPYFTDNFIPNEILLFNPINTMQELQMIPSNTNTININQILIENNINLFSIPYFMSNTETTFFKYGGGKKYVFKENIDYIFEKNLLIDKYYNKKSKKSKNRLNELKKQGNEFKKNILNNKVIVNNEIDYMFERNNILNSMKYL